MRSVRSRAVLGALAVAALSLAGCQSMPENSGPSGDAYFGAGGHGGGVALMRSGEYVTIGADGQVTQRCYMCDQAPGAAGSCAESARALKLELCAAPPAPAAKALSGAMPRSTLYCATYGPNGPLPPIPYSPNYPDYTCFYYSANPPACICLAK